MTIKRANKKNLRPEELSAVNGGISCDYGICDKCMIPTKLGTLQKNNGLCNECAGVRPGGATGSW